MKQLITQHEILTLDDYGRIVSFSSGIIAWLDKFLVRGIAG